MEGKKYGKEYDFLRKRITELRVQKGVTEHKMSFELGHTQSYIQNIMSGRALPSLPVLYDISEYFGVELADFFDEDLKDPLMSNIVTEIRKLEKDELRMIWSLLMILRKNK